MSKPSPQDFSTVRGTAESSSTAAPEIPTAGDKPQATSPSLPDTAPPPPSDIEPSGDVVGTPASVDDGPYELVPPSVLESADHPAPAETAVAAETAGAKGQIDLFGGASHVVAEASGAPVVESPAAPVSTDDAGSAPASDLPRAPVDQGFDVGEEDVPTQSRGEQPPVSTPLAEEDGTSGPPASYEPVREKSASVVDDNAAARNKEELIQQINVATRELEKAVRDDAHCNPKLLRQARKLCNCALPEESQALLDLIEEITACTKEVRKEIERVEKEEEASAAAETRRQDKQPSPQRAVKQDVITPPPLPPAAPKPAAAPQAPVVSAKVLEWWSKNVWANVRAFIQRVRRRIAQLQVVYVFWFLVGMSMLIVGAVLFISEYRPSGPPVPRAASVAKASATPSATASSASDTCPLKNAGDKKVIEARSDLLIKCLKRFADKRPAVQAELSPLYYCEGSQGKHFPLGFTVNCEGTSAGIDDSNGCSNVVGCTLEKE